MLEDVSFTQPTADINFGSIRFEFVESDEAIPAVDAPEIYYDSTVLERQPNRTEDLDVTWQSKYGLVDFGIVQPFVDDRAGFPDQVTSFSFTEEGRDNIWFWKEWLHARAGRWSKFYVPSWSVDFELVEDIAFNDVSIDVVDTDYRTFYWGYPEKQDIMIKVKGGLQYYRRIAAVSLRSEGVERFTLNAPLGASYLIDDVLMISFLHPSRIDFDGIEMTWDHTEMCSLNMNVRTVGK
ncbi:MAG: hypothetical protein GY814_19050 [Gammaproteobacteria bacterium]|nr:hypothetical protein [Gammaproteobacteria bacterium]